MSIAARIGLLLLAVCAAGAAVFLFPPLAFPHDDSPFNWIPFAIVAAVAVATSAVLIWSFFRKDRAPDFLRLLRGRLLERRGMCYVITPAVRGNVFTLQVHFQNRYAGDCSALLQIQPATQFVTGRRRDLRPLTIEFHCPGGAFGIVVIPWGIPSAYQGKRQKLDLTGDTAYLTSRQRLLRIRSGAAMPPPGTARGSSASNVLALLLGGILGLWLQEAATRRGASPVQTSFRLPAGVAKEVPTDVEPTMAVLWRPGMPVDDTLSNTPGMPELPYEFIRRWEFEAQAL